MSADQTYLRLKTLLFDAPSFRDAASRPVFWLGAGCSKSDGVPTADVLLENYLRPHKNSWGSPQFRFDRRIELFATGPRVRLAALRPYFNQTLKDDSPYLHLIKLMKRRSSSIICSFNIDNLLDQAFKKVGMILNEDFDIISVPKMEPGDIRIRIAADQPRIKLIKLHGDLESGVNFMTSREISDYGEGFTGIFTELSERPAVVCGYSFVHLNVLTAFSRRADTPVYYINPEFPQMPAILSLMLLRSKENANFIDGDLGKFEIVMRQLADDIL
jgi:hypothetical protein